MKIVTLLVVIIVSVEVRIRYLSTVKSTSEHPAEHLKVTEATSNEPRKASENDWLLYAEKSDDFASFVDRISINKIIG